MQDDISYQRGLNQKLKDEVRENDKERSDILADLKAQEEIAAKNRADLDDLKEKEAKIARDLSDIQDQYASYLNDIKIAIEEAEMATKKETAREEEKTEMKATVDKLTQERNNMIFRMNDLAEKYELFVKNLNKEKEEIAKTNKKHSKLLTSSILFSHLQNRIHQQMGIAMEQIQKMFKFRKVAARRIGELIKLQNHYKTRVLESAFNFWRRSKLNWAREREITKKLIMEKMEKKQRVIFFMRWRAEYLRSADMANKRLIAAKRIAELKEIQTLKKIRGYFGNWQNVEKMLHKRDLCLKQLLLRILKRCKEEALCKWLMQNKTYSHDQKLIALSELVANEQFKRQMFSRFKHNVYAEEDQKVANSQITLDNKQKEKMKGRFLKASTIAFMNIQRKKEKTLKEEVCESMKFNVLSEMKDRTIMELDKEVPQCTAIENELNINIKQFKELKKKALMRAAFLTFHKRMKYYLEKWYNVPAVFKKRMMNFKKIFARWELNKLSSAFDLWHRRCHKKTLGIQALDQKNAHQEIENIGEEIKVLDQTIQQQQAQRKLFVLNKFLRVAHLIARAHKKSRLRKWLKTTKKLLNVKVGTLSISKLFRKHCLKGSLENYRKQVKNIKEEIGNKYKIQAMNNTIKKRIAKDCIKGLIIEKQWRKQAKKAFVSTIKSLQNHHKKRAINKWKTYTHNSTSNIIKKRNEKLQEIIEKFQENIQNEKKKKVEIEEEIEKWKMKEKDQGTASVFTGFTIWTIRKLSTAFNTWKTKAINDKRKNILLTRYIERHEHTSLRFATYEWRKLTFLMHIQSIKEELKRRVDKYETFTHFSDIKIGETESELKQLKDTYIQLRKKNLLNENRIDGVVKILGRLKEFCICFSFNNNFFLAWVDMFRKEKFLQERLKSISRNYTGKYVFAQLKQKADKLKMKVKVEKAWSRAFNCLSHIICRDKMHFWRAKTKECRNEDKQHETMMHQTQIDEIQSSLENLKERALITFEQEVGNRRKTKILRRWQRQATIQLLFKRKAEQLNDSLRLIKLDRSFLRWRDDIQKLEKRKMQLNKAVTFRTQKKLLNSLREWARINSAEVRLPKLLQKITHRHCINSVCLSLEILKANHKETEQTGVQRKFTSITKLFTLLNGIINSKLANSMAIMSEILEKRRLEKDLLRRVALRTLRRKLSYHFLLWKNKTEEYRLVEYVEAKGQTAEVLSQVRRKYESLQQLVNEEKMALEDREREISEEGGNRRLVSKEAILPEKIDLTKKYILLWARRLAGNSQIGKYINYWKNWINFRKKAEKYADMVEKRFHFKEKACAFSKLRNIKRAAIRTYKGKHRDSIIKK